MYFPFNLSRLFVIVHEQIIAALPYVSCMH
jgi:hypothetical protein